jgi:nitrogen fixation/metabolism regulation signal transduction histidine kinase
VVGVIKRFVKGRVVHANKVGVEEVRGDAYDGIRLECAVVGGCVRVVVSDDGPGVPAADRQVVFGRFVRLDTPRDRVAGGAGLGLSLVTQIVEAHDGTASVDDFPSGGASFVVELPLAADESVARPRTVSMLWPARSILRRKYLTYTSTMFSSPS